MYFGRPQLVCQIKLETLGTIAMRMQTKFLIVFIQVSRCWLGIGFRTLKGHAIVLESMNCEEGAN